MSIFLILDIDKLLINKLDLKSIKLINRLNKYYYNFTNQNITYKFAVDFFGKYRMDPCKFDYSCEYPHPEITKYIYKNYNHKIKLSYAFAVACAYGNLKTATYLIKLADDILRLDMHADGDLAFRWSCSTGQLESIKLLVNLSGLIKSKIDIHAKGEQAFKSACYEGHLDIVKFLLEYGQKTNSPIDIHDNQDETFILALGGGHQDIIKYLLKYSASNSPIIG